MTQLLSIVLYALLSCSDQPQPCAGFCQASSKLYDQCLRDGGASWEDSQWNSQEGYLHSCQTWQWEMLLLEEDALNRDELSEPFLQDYCQEKEQLFLAEEATCTDFSDLNWSSPPWKE